MNEKKENTFSRDKSQVKYFREFCIDKDSSKLTNKNYKLSHFFEVYMPVTKKSSTKSPKKAINVVSKKGKTRLIVKYDAGFKNNLYLRGEGANLNWDKGIQLKNTKTDEWIWETAAKFTSCEFKILINDIHYELGSNHLLKHGETLEHSPKF